MSKKQTAKINTLVGGNSDINGDISFAGGLHIDGFIKGNVQSQGDEESLLIVSQTGRIEGDVRVKNATINGTVIGDIYADNLLEMAEHARVTGNIYYELMEMASGAQINGQLLRNSEGADLNMAAANQSDEVTDLSDLLNKH